MVVEMPSLREREEDILLLSNLFIEEINREYGKKINGLTEDAKKIMVQYPWPGNVRELKNVIERAMILTDQAYITPKQLPFELRQREGYGPKSIEMNPFEISEMMPLEELEKIHLTNVLKKMEWNKSRASKILGISRATLRAKVKKYHLSEN
jgi:transcriptional regulator with PAS, ATPase and Fis domain